MSNKKRKEKVEKKAVCETFDLEKDGKTKVVHACGEESLKPGTKEQIKKENKILRNFFIGVGLIIILSLSGWFAVESVRYFEYRNLEFNVVQEGELIFYNTAIPVIYQGKEVPYNFYLRKDPRKLENIIFEGELSLAENMVIEIPEEFDCDGDETIAIANVLKLYQVFGTKVISDENATCDSEGRYMFLRIQSGEETKIEQFGPKCYTININDCEILEGTEKFMIETFVHLKN